MIWKVEISTNDFKNLENTYITQVFIMELKSIIFNDLYNTNIIPDIISENKFTIFAIIERKPVRIITEFKRFLNMYMKIEEIL